MDIFLRNELYWGQEAQEKLAKSHIAVFGLGGVGGFCAEMLARAGVGELTIIDFDEVSQSNINRQIVALNSTVGQDKTKLFEQRLKDINPDIKINVVNDFYTEKFNKYLLSYPSPLAPYLSQNDTQSFCSAESQGERGKNIGYIADAIDTMRSKVDLLEFAHKNHLPLISSFGAGNRINPEKLYVCDISEIKEKNAPFVSSILYQLKKRGIEKGINVVTSSEKPFCQEKINVQEKVTTKAGDEIEFSKIIPASTPFVASVAGIMMASFIVRGIIGK